MKFLGFACVLFLNLIFIKSISGQTKNFVIGYCDSSNAALIYKETVTVFNNKANETGWFRKFWNWVTFSSTDATILKITKTFPSNGNYQNCNITCIRFADLVQNGTGGVGKISSGGIGKNFVDIELTSQPAKGMVFNVALNGFCRSSYNQSVTNGAVPSQNVGWKWNVSNTTAELPTLAPNQGPDWKWNLTRNNSNSSVYDSRLNSSESIFGERLPVPSNVTGPNWVIPSNGSISIRTDGLIGWNKPLNSSYDTDFHPSKFPPPLIPNAPPPHFPIPNERNSNAPNGWKNDVYNSSERDSRNIGWRKY